jgi:hypothetical protein
VTKVDVNFVTVRQPRRGAPHESPLHTDADGEPHIHCHNVATHEVLGALARPLERVAGRGDTTVLIGRTRGGRVLRVVYAPSRDGDGIFVVTAYDLPDKQYRALNRRLKRRQRK